MLMTTAIWDCLQIVYAVNHTVDEWRRRLSGCVDIERSERCLWLLRSKWQCHDDGIENSIIAIDFLFYCALDINVKQMIAFKLQKRCYLILLSKERTRLR